MITIQERYWLREVKLPLVMRLVVFICISLTSYLFPLSSVSQTLTGSAPSHVSVGEQFRLTYTVNTQNATDFRAGDIPGRHPLPIPISSAPRRTVPSPSLQHTLWWVARPSPLMR